jgi:NCS1 family nucleobase:cation symporter-1
MFAVFAVRYFLRGEHRAWDTSDAAVSQWSMLVPWALGFADWWVTIWVHARSWLHVTPEPWMSASIVSFVVAGLATIAIAAMRNLTSAKVPPSANATQ